MSTFINFRCHFPPMLEIKIIETLQFSGALVFQIDFKGYIIPLEYFNCYFKAFNN